MDRQECRTCEMLKEYYALKFNQFVLAGRFNPASGLGQGTDQEQLIALKDEALEALTALMQHVKACYGLEDLEHEIKEHEIKEHEIKGEAA
jgi:hypothetical protein